MGIMLGNLRVTEIEERLGITLTEQERTELNRFKQESAKLKSKDEWHCFDMPFMIVCGSDEMATVVKDILSPYGKEMKCSIRIGVQ